MSFDARVAVVVRDLNGERLDHATAALRALPAAGGGGGQLYALGAAPRELGVEVPGLFELRARCWGHAQVGARAAFRLDHASWPASWPGEAGGHSGAGGGPGSGYLGGSSSRAARSLALLASGGAGGGAAAPLELEVRMLRFDVAFSCEDVLGRPLTHADVAAPGAGEAFGGEDGCREAGGGGEEDGFKGSAEGGGPREAAPWRLVLVEHEAAAGAAPGPAGTYVVEDLLGPPGPARTVTVSGVEGADGEPKSWSLEVASGRFFVSHLIVGGSGGGGGGGGGGRRVHPADFSLAVEDWLGQYHRAAGRGGGGGGGGAAGALQVCVPAGGHWGPWRFPHFFFCSSHTRKAHGFHGRNRCDSRREFGGPRAMPTPTLAPDPGPRP